MILLLLLLLPPLYYYHHDLYNYDYYYNVQDITFCTNV